MADDKRIFPGFMVDLDPFTVVMIDEPYLLFQYQTQWWPRTDMLTGCGDEMLGAPWTDKTELVQPVGGGTNSRMAIFGTCRDVNGTPVVGAIVKLFKTADLPSPGKDIILDTVISDANGNYTVTTPYYPDTHYIVEYKTGSPDIFGSSRNDLIGV
jgi:hypothetical protein